MRAWRDTQGRLPARPAARRPGRRAAPHADGAPGLRVPQRKARPRGVGKGYRPPMPGYALACYVAVTSQTLRTAEAASPDAARSGVPRRDRTVYSPVADALACWAQRPGTARRVQPGHGPALTGYGTYTWGRFPDPGDILPPRWIFRSLGRRGRCGARCRCGGLGSEEAGLRQRSWPTP